MRIYGIELATFFWVGEDVICFLDTLKEAIIVRIADGASFFVRVVPQNLFAV
jgi:hypothetical protein